jgi:hypothetical protein
VTLSHFYFRYFFIAQIIPPSLRLEPTRRHHRVPLVIAYRASIFSIFSFVFFFSFSDRRSSMDRQIWLWERMMKERTEQVAKVGIPNPNFVFLLMFGL